VSRAEQAAAHAVVRRTEVLDHARHVIMRDGLSTTSLRRISREGGYTTGVLSHYFADKRDLISTCFEWTMTNWLDRVQSELADAPTAEESVLTYVRIAIPHAPERQAEWRLWLDFCSAAVGNPELAEVLLRVDGRWDAATAAALARWQAAGLVRSELPVAEHAGTLVRLVDGLGLRSLLTGDWDAARRGFVDVLRMLGLSDELAAAALAPPPAGAGA
jgi:AcrR family transcriptional regulator